MVDRGARSRRADGRPASGPPADHRVLLLSRRGDAEVAALASCLRRIGVPFHVVHADELDGLAVSVDLDERTVTIGEDSFVATVTWLRHFSMRAAPRGRDPAHHLFYCDSWTALAGQLPAVSKAVLGHGQPGRFEQHVRAAALGVRTPRAVVTADPAAARHGRLTRGRRVVKALDQHFVEPEPGSLAWYHPRIGERAGPVDAAGFAGAPVLLQEYVRHDAELRVYVVGGEIHAFRVVKRDPGDLWSRPDSVEVHCVAPPPAVADAARALADTWKLVYGAFDFLLDGREPVFLEVNADGDWRWFERKAGVGSVSDAAARTVRDLHRSLVAGATRRLPPVDLLTFLGAGPKAA